MLVWKRSFGLQACNDTILPCHFCSVINKYLFPKHLYLEELFLA